MDASPIRRWPGSSSGPAPRKQDNGGLHPGHVLAAKNKRFGAFSLSVTVLSLAGTWPGNDLGMPTDRSARRVVTFAMGIAAILDLTGMRVYRTMRPVLPPRRPREASQDPIQAAMSTIMTAHRDAVVRAHNKSGA